MKLFFPISINIYANLPQRASNAADKIFIPLTHTSFLFHFKVFDL